MVGMVLTIERSLTMPATKPALFCDTIARFGDDGAVYLMNKPFPRYGWSTQALQFESLAHLCETFAVTCDGPIHRDQFSRYVFVDRILPSTRLNGN